MKQILSILAIALVVLTGCSKNDDDKKDLIGTWVLEKIVEEETTPPATASLKKEEKECPPEITFMDNNKFKAVNYRWSEEAKECVVPEYGITEGTYTLHENKITFTYTDTKETDAGEIIKLSKNQLIIKVVDKNGTGILYFKRK